MSLSCEVADEVSIPQHAAWGAVLSMAFGVFGLITAEFLPVSLLTPIADSLQISEGQAGQTVTVTALLALLTSLFIGPLTRRTDRRVMMLSFSLLMVASCLMVALATNLPLLLAARVLLGIAIGGFWTLSTAIAMRLVPAKDVPRALSIVFSGVSLSTIIAAPLASYLGGLIGWRDIFMLAAALGVLGFIWQYFTLPSMPPKVAANAAGAFGLLRRSVMRWGMLTAAMIFSAHFAFFTYMRPFIETAVNHDLSQLSLILLAFGVSNFVGTLLAGVLLSRHIALTLSGAALLMAIIALVLTQVGDMAGFLAVGVAFWGLTFGVIPPGWSTWIARVVPDEAEAGGGLLVASIQSAISVGAAAGGWLYDGQGAVGLFWGSGIMMLLAAFFLYSRVRQSG